MSNSPLICTAVKLCLIAAMVIQPMALTAARGACVQESAAGGCGQAITVCHACRCCDVKTAGDLCACCRGNDEAAGCCTKQVADKISDVVPELPAVAEVVKASDRTANEASANGFRDEPALSTCMCGMRSEPLPPLPGPVPQSRELVVIGYLNHIALDAGLSFRPDRAASYLPIGKRSPHFSQRYLCIWRI